MCGILAEMFCVARKYAENIHPAKEIKRGAKSMCDVFVGVVRA